MELTHPTVFKPSMSAPLLLLLFLLRPPHLGDHHAEDILLQGGQPIKHPVTWGRGVTETHTRLLKDGIRNALNDIL